MEMATITAWLTIASGELFCKSLSVKKLEEEYQKQFYK